MGEHLTCGLPNAIRTHSRHLQSNRICCFVDHIAILRCNVAILMHKLLKANCDRFDKLLSKSYNVLKIHLQIFFAKQRVKIQKVHVEKK